MLPAELPAKQMPWDWFTRVRESTGPKRTYHMKVNGRDFLRARARSAAEFVRSALATIPTGARVSVRRLR